MRKSQVSCDAPGCTFESTGSDFSRVVLSRMGGEQLGAFDLCAEHTAKLGESIGTVLPGVVRTAAPLRPPTGGGQVATSSEAAPAPAPDDAMPPAMLAAIEASRAAMQPQPAPPPEPDDRAVPVEADGESQPFNDEPAPPTER